MCLLSLDFQEQFSYSCSSSTAGMEGKQLHVALFEHFKDPISGSY